MKNIFTRNKHNPILQPDKNLAWASRQIYNPTIIKVKNEYNLFFRAVGDDWRSSIGKAVSLDGENFEIEDKPIVRGESKLEKNGVEDPRICLIDNKYFLTYTAYDGDTARLSFATSKNLKNWKKHGVAVKNWDADKAHSFVVGWDSAQIGSRHKKEWLKAGAIFPERFNGEYLMLFGDRDLWLASSREGNKWKTNNRPFIIPRPGYFDFAHVEAGPAPMRTKNGWLVLYHGVDEKITYRLGYLLLDLKNPRKIIKRSEYPIFEPIYLKKLEGLADILPGGKERIKNMSEKNIQALLKKTKKNKLMPKVVFCCGAILEKELLKIYYGANDTYICTAQARISDVINSD